MGKPKHYKLLHNLFITDGKPNKQWLRITLGTRAKDKHKTLKNYILSSVDSGLYGEFIYLLAHDWVYPTCKICGKKLRYNPGYKTYCSRKCARADQDITNIAVSRKNNFNKFIENLNDAVTIDINNLEQYDDEYLNKIYNNGFTNYYSKVKTSLNNDYVNIRYWLNNRISWASSWSETIYCLLNKISEQPKCNICGKNLPFKNFNKGYRLCIHREKKSKPKLSVVKKEKIKKQRILLSPEERRRAKVAGYYKWWNSLSDEERKQHNKKVSDAVRKWSATRTDEQKKEKTTKEILTKKRNGTLNASSPEKRCFEYAKKLFPGVSTQVISKYYPFHVDIFIEEIDTYIEYQGSWTHGGHPYNSNNVDDINLLNKWKEKGTEYYLAAIDVWTRRDPIKRKTAKDNNLNWYECWTEKECYDLIDKLYEEYKKHS